MIAFVLLGIWALIILVCVVAAIITLGLAYLGVLFLKGCYEWATHR